MQLFASLGIQTEPDLYTNLPLVNATKPEYRPDIDGLRAIAIAGVLIYHIEETWLTGGFLGVDVFFVISGFLITSIISREVRENRFSFGAFYERRIRRIIPALFALLAVVSCVAFVTMWPGDLNDFGKSLKYTVISLSNVHFLDFTQDYFNDDARRIPLLHTWSLAVEEQYYIFFPPLLIALHKWKRMKSNPIMVVGVIAALSLAACIVVGHRNPASSFFLIPFRAWELFAGSLLALGRFSKPSDKAAQALSVIGVLFILSSFLFVSEHNFIPGVSAVPAILGAMMLIRAGSVTDRPWSVRMLAMKPFVGLGLISYSVYLWHWPIIVFSRIIFAETLVRDLTIVMASLFLGWLSWRYVERPFRKAGVFHPKMVWISWAVATGAFVLCGNYMRSYKEAANHRSSGTWLFDRSPLVRTLMECKEGNPRFSPNIKIPSDPAKARAYGDPNAKPTIAIWGDSHAAALLSELDRQAKLHNKAFKYFGLGGVPPIPGVVVEGSNGGDVSDRERSTYSDNVMNELLRNESLSTVVLHARWSQHNRGKNEHKQTKPLKFFGQNFSTQSELDAYYDARIRATVHTLLSAGKRVVVIGPIPEVGVNVPDALLRQHYRGEPLAQTMDASGFYNRQSVVLNTLSSLEPNARLLVIMPHERLLSGDRVKVMEDGKPLYRDDDHLSGPGASYIGDVLAPIFN